MNHDFWIRNKNFKLFGFQIFSIEEIFKETDYEGDVLKVSVSPDYFKSEFEDCDD